MSSMTDLVFLLLIFFIILSTLVSPYSLPVELPKGDNQSKDVKSVSLRIGADLQYSVSNKVIDEADVEAALLEALKSKSEKSVILHIDASVPTGKTIEVLGIAKKHRWKTAVATTPK